MSRWWGDGESARSTLSLVDGSDLTTEVGIAVLGLHGLGADAIGTDVSDDEALTSAFAKVMTEPVEAAWATAFDGYVDDPDVYASGRVGDLKGDADAGARLMVRSLTSAGVAWPLAVQRAAQGYGLPPRDAAAYVRKVAAPVVPPAVVAHEADQALAAYAARLGELESDLAPQRVAKADREYHGDDPDERDERGRFAPKGGDRTKDDDTRSRRAEWFSDRRQKRQRRRRAAPKQQERVRLDAPDAQAAQQAEVARVHAEILALNAEQKAQRSKQAAANPEQARRDMVMAGVLKRQLHRQQQRAAAAQAEADAARKAAEIATQVDEAMKVRRAIAEAEAAGARAEAEKQAATDLAFKALESEDWDDADFGDRARAYQGTSVTLGTGQIRFSAIPLAVHQAMVADQEFSATPYVQETSPDKLKEVIGGLYDSDALTLLRAHSAQSFADQVAEMVANGTARYGARPGQIEVRRLDDRWDSLSLLGVTGAKIEIDDADIEEGHRGGGRSVLPEEVAYDYAPTQRLAFSSADIAPVYALADVDEGRGVDFYDAATGYSPWKGETLMGLPVSSFSSDVPAPNEVDVTHAVRVSRERRYHSEKIGGVDLLGESGYDDDGYPGMSKRSYVTKADREYHGDDPDERDEQGRFAPKGGGRSASSEQRRREWWTKHQATRSRRRRVSGQPSRAPVRLDAPQPAAAAPAAAPMARSVAATDDSSEALRAQLLRAQLLRAQTRRGAQRRAAQKVAARREQAKTDAAEQATDYAAPQKTSSASVAEELQASVTESLADAIGTSNTVAVYDLGDDTWDSMRDFLEEAHRGATDAYRDLGSGQEFQDETARILNGKNSRGESRRKEGFVGARGGLTMSVLTALESAIAASVKPTVPLSAAPSSAEFARLRGKGFRVESKVDPVTGDRHYFRSRAIDETPVTLVFGESRGGASLTDRLAHDATIYDTVEMTTSRELARALRSIMTADGRTLPPALSRRLAVIEQRDEVPIEFVATR